VTSKISIEYEKDQSALWARRNLQGPLSNARILSLWSFRKKAVNSLETGLKSLRKQDQTKPDALAMQPIKRGFSRKRSRHLKISNNGSLPKE
jgi:hypothetical protein